jgi:hypothetical protein
MLPCPCHASEFAPPPPGSVAAEISDDNLAGLSMPPVIEGRVTARPGDGKVSSVALLEVVVTDNCGVLADNVSIDVTTTTGGVTLSETDARITQSGPRMVEVNVSVEVSGFEASQGQVQFSLSVFNNCGLSGTRLFLAAFGGAG